MTLGENGLFVNYGGRFVDETKQRGALDPGNGMGVSFGDYDNDGLLDLHVTNMSSTAGNRILGRLFPDANPTGQVLKKLASRQQSVRDPERRVASRMPPKMSAVFPPDGRGAVVSSTSTTTAGKTSTPPMALFRVSR